MGCMSEFERKAPIGTKKKNKMIVCENILGNRSQILKQIKLWHDLRAFVGKTYLVIYGPSDLRF